jgi:hypothetical protein
VCHLSIILWFGIPQRKQIIQKILDDWEFMIEQWPGFKGCEELSEGIREAQVYAKI